jgi:hypothetical protein
MHTNQWRVAVTLPLALLSGTALAETPSVDLGGLLYAHYGYLLDEEAHGYNEFDIDRVYLTARSKLGKGFSARVTTDMGRTGSEDDTRIRTYLKYAYLETKLNDEFKLRFGASGTAWCSQYDNFVDHRWISRSLADKNKVLSTSDIGVQALGKHMDGMVRWQAGIINGNGYSRPEVSRTKAIQGRVTVDPMSGNDDIKLPIAAFVSQDIMVAEEEEGGQVIAAGLGVDTNYALVWGEYLMHNEGDASASGYNATVLGKIGDIANVLVRYDSFDPSTKTDDDATTTIITGLTKDVHAGISAGLTYERATPQADPDAVSHGVFVRMQAGF